ncbi:hypothetical protein NDU88_006998 [Pleurodeles waltl]|uniref:Uncharacterized protein n=1 Tax=Pleurodeles waltl TaxID=8319 RepID=A0AAV7WC68_PLEWA|nr:hypothetical protein NDU88_006998 [Pleurodeles waltl]
MLPTCNQVFAACVVRHVLGIPTPKVAAEGKVQQKTLTKWGRRDSFTCPPSQVLDSRVTVTSSSEAFPSVPGVVSSVAAVSASYTSTDFRAYEKPAHFELTVSLAAMGPSALFIPICWCCRQNGPISRWLDRPVKKQGTNESRGDGDEGATDSLLPMHLDTTGT